MAVAIVYDFDRTLSTTDMEEYSLIPALGLTADEYWRLCEQRSVTDNTDSITSALMTLIDQCKLHNVDITKEELSRHGTNIVLHKGVESWFDNVKELSDKNNVDVKHYVISCGLKSMIEATPIASKFHHIYASDIDYTHNRPIALTHDDKVSILKTIASNADRIIYLGDGSTDIPSFKFVRENNGIAIGIRQADIDNSHIEQYVDYTTDPDYTVNGQLYNILDKMLFQLS